MSFSGHNSIHFPPGTITSKLNSNMLKRPSISNDWMHQTYMELIQDVSYATSHYYESDSNGTSLFMNAPEPNTQSGTLNRMINRTTSPKKSSPLSYNEYHPTISDKESVTSSSDESEICNTYTTSSTDCNRKNNIYRFYREQQSLEQPIEEETILKIVPPHNQECDSQPTTLTHNSLNVIVTQDTNKVLKQNNRFKKFKRIMTKMRMAAEEPFWAIDNRF